MVGVDPQSAAGDRGGCSTHLSREPSGAGIRDERISLADAIAAFTAGSAYVNHLDEETGSIEVGKAADLVVLDRNIFEEESIGDAAVAATIVGGEVAFRADG